MPLKLEVLKREHILDIFPRIRGDVVGTPLHELVPQVMYMASYGSSYAAVNDGMTIMIGGLINNQQGTGHLWLIGSEETPKFIKGITRILRTRRDDVMKDMGIHRIQSEVLLEKKSWILWAKLFGLVEEGIMRKYTRDGKDCVMMAYVLEDGE